MCQAPVVTRSRTGYIGSQPRIDPLRTKAELAPAADSDRSQSAGTTLAIKQLTATPCALRGFIDGDPGTVSAFGVEHDSSRRRYDLVRVHRYSFRELIGEPTGRFRSPGVCAESS